jgi:molybdopterin-guanine dinucleotide biosynthesis protein MobB
MIDFPIPVLGFVAWSGTGKTTLLSEVIPLLKTRGLRIALVKHAHHNFDIDHPGKDSYRLRKAGADEVVIASRHRIASVRETPSNQEEPSLSDILSIIQPGIFDIVLIEGFKMEDIPKLELHRKCLNRPYLYLDDSNIIALALDSDTAGTRHDIECLDLRKPAQIASFVERFIKLRSKHENLGQSKGQPRLRQVMR